MRGFAEYLLLIWEKCSVFCQKPLDGSVFLRYTAKEIKTYRKEAARMYNKNFAFGTVMNSAALSVCEEVRG